MTTLARRLAKRAVSIALLLSANLVSAQEPQNHAAPSQGQKNHGPVLAEGTLLRVAFPSRVDWARLPQGSQLEGTLSLPLFAGSEMVVPSGSVVRLTVASSERVREKRGFWSNTGHAIVRAFNPLERVRAPEYRVTLSSSELLLSQDNAMPLRAIVLRAGSAMLVEARRAETLAAPKTSGNTEQRKNGRSRAGSVLVLRLGEPATVLATQASASQNPAESEGRRAVALLLNALSASHSREGESFQAWLAEPLHIGGHFFETGSLLQGAVVRSVPPRMLSRAGKLYVRFDRLISKEGETAHVTGNLATAEADSQGRFVLDEEGLARGRKPGVKEGLADLGLAFALGKVSDDIAETPIRAIGASLSDAAVANAARYVGLASAVTFLVTRRGRDVYLPPYSQICVELGRASEPPAPSPTATPSDAR